MLCKCVKSLLHDLLVVHSINEAELFQKRTFKQPNIVCKQEAKNRTQSVFKMTPITCIINEHMCM